LRQEEGWKDEAGGRLEGRGRRNAGRMRQEEGWKNEAGGRLEG
jgi:hypothetical protein